MSKPKKSEEMASTATLFSMGNYQAVAESGRSDEWQTYAALGLLGKTDAAIAGLERFDHQDARFYSAVASWINGDDYRAERELAKISTTHAQNLLRLIRLSRIEVLAQVWETKDGFWGIVDGIAKDPRFRVRTIQNYPYLDVHRLYDQRHPPQFYICAQVEWHLVPPNVQELPCPIFAQTGDPDIHIQAVYPWLKLFDEIVTTSFDEWEDARQLARVPTSVFPKLFSLPLPQPHLNPFHPRPYDVTFTGAWLHPYQPEKARLLHQVYRIKGIKRRLCDGYLDPDSYLKLLASSKIVICFSRYTACLPSRGLEALSMGAAPLIPRGNVWGLYVGESEGVFQYNPEGSDLPHTIVRILRHWPDVVRRLNRGSAMVRREFSRTRVASQYMRFLTFLAAKPRPPRRQSPQVFQQQKRLVLWRGGFPGGPKLREALRVANQDRWLKQRNLKSPHMLIDMARELALLATELAERIESKGAGSRMRVNFLLSKVTRLYQIGITLFPKSLVLRFNFIRVALHLGSPSQVTSALDLCEETLNLPESTWEIDAMQDIFPYDFFSHFFNYREYFDLITAHLKTGRSVDRDLVRLILASLHNYLGHYREGLAHFATAVNLDPAFPFYKLSYARALLRRGKVQDREQAKKLLMELAESSWLFREAYALLERYWGLEIASSPRLEEIAQMAMESSEAIDLTSHSHPFDVWGSTPLRHPLVNPHHPSVLQVPLREGSSVRMTSQGRSGEPFLVSAIVSVYNAERFMRGLLEDLEAQTIADRVEIIVIDSNSPQEEAAIVKDFQKRYDNIVYIRTERRETSHAAVNRGIKAARGKYITLANADDRHRADAFERMVEVLEAHPEVALVYANVYITKKENETFGSHTEAGRYRWLDFDPLRLIFGCFIGPQPMWRRSVHKKYGYFDPSLESAGDWEFWLRITETEKFIHLDEFLGLYLYSPSSVEHRNPELSRSEAIKVHKMYLPRAARILGKRLAANPEEQMVEQINQMEARIPSQSSTLPLLIVDSSQGSPAQLVKCLRRVEESTEKLPKCLIVGPNAAPGSKFQMKVSFAPNQTLLDALSQSMRLDIHQVILLSSDVLVSKGWLEGLVDGVGNTHIAAVGPCSNQAPAPQRIETNYRSLEGGLRRFANQRYRLYNGHWQEVPYLGSFCLLLNLDIVHQVGGLPSSKSLPDALWKLFLRLRSANYKLVIKPGVYVHHAKLNLKEGGDFDQRANVRSQELAKLSEEEFHGRNFVKAGEYLEESLNLDPQNADALNDLGVMLLENGMVFEALNLFERAKKLDPENEDIASNHKDTVLLAQKLSRFNSYINNELARHKKMMRSKGREGGIEQEVSKPKGEKAMEKKSEVNHDLDEAIDIYRKLAKDDPHNVENLKTLSEKLTEAGRYDEAVSYWEDALKLSPNSDSYQSLGKCYYNLEQYEKAKEVLVKGLEMNPDDSGICNDLGVVSLTEGNLEEAIGYFQRGLKSNPDSPEILLNLALICYQVGMYGEAAGLLEKYASLEPLGADVHLCLGDCYFHMERKDLAKREFELALSIDPELKEAEERLQELEG